MKAETPVLDVACGSRMTTATKTFYHLRPKSRWRPCSIRRELSNGIEIIVDGKFRFVARENVREGRK